MAEHPLPIRRLRQERQMTLQDVATEVGVTKGHLSLVERGLRSPSQAVMDKLLDSLQATDRDRTVVCRWSAAMQRRRSLEAA